jgi:hypothetical protein
LTVKNRKFRYNRFLAKFAKKFSLSVRFCEEKVRVLNNV